MKTSIVFVMLGAVCAAGMGAPTLWHCLVFGFIMYLVQEATRLFCQWAS